MSLISLHHIRDNFSRTIKTSGGREHCLSCSPREVSVGMEGSSGINAEYGESRDEKVRVIKPYVRNTKKRPPKSEDQTSIPTLTSLGEQDKQCSLPPEVLIVREKLSRKNIVNRGIYSAGYLKNKPSSGGVTKPNLLLNEKLKSSFLGTRCSPGLTEEEVLKAQEQCLKQLAGRPGLHKKK
eukprot:TRINITY_DN12645_c0_g1_i4.p1 TRINITY_DN12645_c0_g1~~TRINITY_DN12645_c0_g1_i4.p1  ORF type:complete len:181 (-),score=36.45 TRINITY_DN12645_c0_g1_i4:71-613(-)